MEISNMHIHSKYSWDCKMELEDIVKVLIDSGVTYAGICDHVEFNYEALMYVLTKFRIRNLEIDALNEKYQGKIKLLKGVEISSPHLYPDKVDALKELDLDFMMGSIHKINRKVKTKEEKKAGTYKYYQDVLNMVKANQVDIFGHIDYINRYYQEDYSDKDVIKEIFETIVKNDKIIEINTSAPRRTKGEYSSFPSIDKLEIYATLRKEVTIGTDAHKLNELTYMLSENNYIAKRKNLEPVIFEKRKMIKL